MFARAGWIVILLAASAVIFGVTAMAREKLDPAAVRKFLDDRYPFIDQGAEPSGPRSGKGGWRTRHGDAVVLWQSGRPVQVWNIVLPDGSSVEAAANMGSPLPWRYRLPGEPRRWQHGTVEVRADGVTFTPGELPLYVPPPASGVPDLEMDLAHDQALRSRLADENFADILYAYLKNGEFWKEGGSASG